MPNQTTEWARIGAAQRLEMLRAEVSAILRTFPELGRGGAVNNGASGTATPQRGRKRRNWSMSDAQKRVVSARMKKYWAERRKAKAATKTAK